MSPSLLLRFTPRHAPRSFIYLRRNFATHRESPASSFLSNPAHRQNKHDTLGPFTLGTRPNPANQPKQKPWSELSTTGKVARGTARTTNLTVIVIGGVFTCVLAYALATELFAKNSPTRLYDDACQKIAASPDVARYLGSQLKFHINAPSPNAPRHRNRHVSSQLAVDSEGREHLLLHFYVESVLPTQALSGDLPASWSEITASSAYEWVEKRCLDLADYSKKAFAYIVGIRVSQDNSANSSQKSLPASPSPVRQTDIGKHSPPPSSPWSFAGLFAGLRSSNASTVMVDDSNIKWTEGEVHADLIKVDDGNFVYRYLLVDIPHSRTRKPLRVYVVKGPHFREGEGVFIWSQ
ncbi:hypothetical protein FRB99_006223 [Tulasnella sp. 403]|nr:hypothetical protein FRB99_006223 [Tulasnella sp. 403]